MLLKRFWTFVPNKLHAHSKNGRPFQRILDVRSKKLQAPIKKCLNVHSEKRFRTKYQRLHLPHNERTNMNEWMNEWVSEWVSEWMNKCKMDEWMNHLVECFCFVASFFFVGSFCCFRFVWFLIFGFDCSFFLCLSLAIDRRLIGQSINIDRSFHGSLTSWSWRYLERVWPHFLIN